MDDASLIDLISGELPKNAGTQKQEKIKAVQELLRQKGFVPGEIPLRLGQKESGAYSGLEKDGVVVSMDEFAPPPHRMSDFVFLRAELYVQSFGDGGRSLTACTPIVPESKLPWHVSSTGGFSLYSLEIEVQLLDPARTASQIEQNVARVSAHLTSEYKEYRAQLRA